MYRKTPYCWTSEISRSNRIGSHPVSSGYKRPRGTQSGVRKRQHNVFGQREWPNRWQVHWALVTEDEAFSEEIHKDVPRPYLVLTSAAHAKTMGTFRAVPLSSSPRTIAECSTHSPKFPCRHLLEGQWGVQEQGKCNGVLADQVAVIGEWVRSIPMSRLTASDTSAGVHTSLLCTITDESHRAAIELLLELAGFSK